MQSSLLDGKSIKPLDPILNFYSWNDSLNIMKSYLNFRDKKEIKNPTKISFTLEWSVEDIHEMTRSKKTKDEIEALIIENQDRFMELIAYIADEYLTEAVSSSGTKLTGSILYSIADDITRRK